MDNYWLYRKLAIKVKPRLEKFLNEILKKDQGVGHIELDRRAKLYLLGLDKSKLIDYYIFSYGYKDGLVFLELILC